MAWLNYNGVFLEDDKPFLLPGNRSFRFGDGLFESARIINKRINFFTGHLDRLLKGMEILSIQPAENFTKESIENIVEELLKKNKFENARLRISVFRSGEGLYTPANNMGSYIIEMVPIAESEYHLNLSGLSIESYEEIKKPVNILSNLKTANALIYVMAAMHKTRTNTDDCILMNEYENVCEAVSSNIFIVKEKVVITPSLSEGCVAGVMRTEIIRLGRNAGLQLKEEKISLNDLITADEVFLTNAAKGIQWVGAFRQKRYYNDTSRLLTEALNKNK